jgi:hypothetical protein
MISNLVCCSGDVMQSSTNAAPAVHQMGHCAVVCWCGQRVV